MSNFVKNVKFCQNCQILSKKSNFIKNVKFYKQKCQSLPKKWPILSKNVKSCQKCQILSKNVKFCLKVTNFIKKWHILLLSSLGGPLKRWLSDIFRLLPTSENVGNCRNMSENVGKCWKMSEIVQKMSEWLVGGGPLSVCNRGVH